MRVCSDCQRCYDDSVVSCVEGHDSELPSTRPGGTDVVPGYYLESLLSSGPLGETYRAGHTASRRSCLIRILSHNENCVPQFLKESKIAAALYHPNVVDVYEAGTLDSGEFFVVSEDAEGRTLRELLNHDRVPELLTSILIVRQAAEALHFLHQSGLTHRAVCPNNIILTTDEEGGTLVRIQNPDFGGVGERSMLSNKFLVGSALNSLKYFAPEQCAGAAVGIQTDVYGLGAVFYEMLAGSPPFDASTATGLIKKHRDQPPPDVRIADFNLRMLVTHALTESLQKPARLRQSSANVFARQLRHIEQLATHTSTPPPAGVVPPTPERPTITAPLVAASVDEILDVQHEHFDRTMPSVISLHAEVGHSDAEQKVETEPFSVLRNETESHKTPKVEIQPLSYFADRSEPVADLIAEAEPPFPTECNSYEAIDIKVDELDIERNVESEPPAPVEVETLLTNLSADPGIANTAVGNAAIPNALHEEPAPATRRSRLMFPKRKSNRTPAPLYVDESESELIHVVEASELERVRPQAAPSDAHFAEAQEPGMELSETERSGADLLPPEPNKVSWESHEYDIDPINEDLEDQLWEQVMGLAAAKAELPPPSPYFLQADDFFPVEEVAPDDALWSAAIARSSTEEIIVPAALEVRSEPAALPLKEAIEPVPVIDSEIVSQVLPAIPVHSVEMSAVETRVPEEKAIPLVTPATKSAQNGPVSNVERNVTRPVVIRAETAEDPIVKAEPKKLAAAAGRMTKVKWDLPEDDVPSLEDVIQELSHDHAVDLPADQQEPKIAKPVPLPIGRVVNEPERSRPLDVSPPVEVLPPGRTREITFRPTILGERDTPRSSVPDRSSPLFARYHGGKRRDLSSVYRAGLVGGAGVAVTVVLLFVGGSVLNDRVQSKEPRRSAVAETTTRQIPSHVAPQEQKRPPETQPETADLGVKETVPKSIDELLKRDVRSDDVRPKAAPIKKSSPAPVAKPEASEVKDAVPGQTPKPARVGRTASKSSQAPSTLVISSQNGKLTSKVETSGQAAATRPRIVANPSH